MRKGISRFRLDEFGLGSVKGHKLFHLRRVYWFLINYLGDHSGFLSKGFYMQGKRFLFSMLPVFVQGDLLILESVDRVANRSSEVGYANELIIFLLLKGVSAFSLFSSILIFFGFVVGVDY